LVENSDAIFGCVLIPDGKLSQVPWAALPGKKPGSYLIEEYAISTIGFGQQLYGLLASKPVTGRGLVLAGGIDYSRSPEKGSSSPAKIQEPLIAGRRRAAATKGDKNVIWQSLPGTAKEAQQIEQLYRQDASRKSVYLTGRSAGEEDVARAMTGGRYVHLATHGFFAAPGIKSIFDFDPRQQTLFEGAASRRSSASVGGRNPLLLSGVVLSGANLGARKDKYGFPTGEDGILTAEEVTNLKLRNTDLVVLSVCETGLGDVAAGEGVFGLQRAFHIAGARTVIASMWNVDDVATQALMVAFYRNLWKKKLGKLEALRQAQLSMIRNFNPTTGRMRSPDLAGKTKKFSTSKNKKPTSRSLSPKYWAVFTLSGDWR
jgi:CHAT domain-containing protein